MKPRTQPPVPENWQELLTEHQALSLVRMQQFGWTIAFIRRPLFLENTVVLHHESLGYKELLGSGETQPFYAVRDNDLK
jgi:hypothetical protein